MSGFSDDNRYYRYAERVLIEGPFIYDADHSNSIEYVVGPALPWLLSIIMLISKSWLFIFIVNAFVSTLTVWLIYLLAKEIFGQKVALMSAFWSAIYIPLIFTIPSSGKDLWMIFWLTTVLYLSVRSVSEKNGIIYTLLLSIAFVFSFHLDERFFAFAPLIFFFLFFSVQGSFFEKLKRPIFYSCVVILLSIPFLIRNYIVFEKIVIISPRTEQFTDKIFGYDPVFGIGTRIESAWFLNEEQIDSVNNGTKTLYDNGRKIPMEKIKAIKNGNLPKEFTKAERYLSAFIMLWKPVDLIENYAVTGYRFDGKWSLKHNLSIALTYGILLPFFLCGLVLLFFDKRKWFYYLFSIILIWTLIHTLFIPFSQNRYRFCIDPLIIIIAFYCVEQMVYYLRGKYIKRNSA